MQDPVRSTSAIQDYGLIGDCRSAALVSRHGSLDWLCWPRFDSPAIFAAILDPEKGGHWRIAPVAGEAATAETAAVSITRRYVDSTNVLETRFSTSSGAAVLTDLMPVASMALRRREPLPEFEILRQVRCESGEIEFECDFQPRPDFARRVTKMRGMGKLGLQLDCGRAVCYLRSDLDRFQPESQHGLRRRFKLRAGEKVAFSLTYNEHAPAVLPLLGEHAHLRINRSVAWWQQWSKQIRYDGAYRGPVLRSALALKLMTYAPSGAIIAAPTTSLPERVGGGLNWDYRFCWLRDASMTARALFGLGFREEADAFVGWLLSATALTQPELNVMYDIFGEKAQAEKTLPHLSGFCGSKPVRIGNGARDQLQLDVYGETVDAVMHYISEGKEIEGETAKLLLQIGKYICSNWQLPDEGIWEPRSGRRQHTHSKVLCWTVLDRLITLHEKRKLPKLPADDFRRERERIAEEVRRCAWNPTINSYVSEYGGHNTDAALLLLPWYGFEKADSARMRGTFARIEQELGVGPGLIIRHRTTSEWQEGAFAICCFWAAECAAMGASSTDDACRRMDELVARANDLGLFAEEIDPACGAALGNFPQAFTHVGLINAALTLAHIEQGRHPMPHHEGESHNPREGAQSQGQAA